jgi:5-formyltetrahydrofolate cyclo-ligase
MLRRDMDAATEQALRVQVKAELRQRMRGLRRVLPKPARAARSAAICARLIELPEFARASTVVAYAATATEANPEQALATAARAGKTVGLPRVDAQGRLSLHHYRAGDALVLSSSGIEEPSADAPRLEAASIDLIVVPALGFDSRGQRIGYGQGHYDRLLPLLERAFKVVIGFDFQLLVQTPDTPGDVALDCIVTDARVLVATAS